MHKYSVQYKVNTDDCSNCTVSRNEAIPVIKHCKVYERFRLNKYECFNERV